MLRPIKGMQFDAAEIDVNMLPDGTAAILTIVSPVGGAEVSLPRAALERLHRRISDALSRSIPPSGED